MSSDIQEFSLQGNTSQVVVCFHFYFFKLIGLMQSPLFGVLALLGGPSSQQVRDPLASGSAARLKVSSGSATKTTHAGALVRTGLRSEFLICNLENISSLWNTLF